MKRFLFLSILCLALLSIGQAQTTSKGKAKTASKGQAQTTSQGQAQTISKVNFDAINKAISSPKSKLYYPTLMKRYKANDPTLTLEDYKHLYYGWPKQSGYDPYRPNDKSDDLNEMLLYERFQDIVKTGKEILAVDPFNMDVMYLMHMAYGELNNKAESLKWLKSFEGLMGAIKASGNGRSFENAVVLIAPRDEYMFLTVVGLRQSGKAQLVENKYHRVLLKEPNKLNLTEVLFNIQIATARKK